MSTRQRIIGALKFSRVPMTAMQLHEVIPGVSIGTLSGELCKLANKGWLLRQDSFGPRGGYGYTIKEPDRWAPAKSAWSRILSDEDF